MKKFLLSFLCFLLAIAGGYAEEVTYTVASTSAVTISGSAPSGSSATYNSTYTTKCQLTKNNSMTLTLKGFAGNKITGIKMSMKSNKSGGSGNFSANVGNQTISSIATAAFNNKNWYGSWSQKYVDITPTITETEVKQGENIVIKIAATANSLYCQSFTITYESVGGDSGETPVAPNAPTLSESCSFYNAMHVEITNIPDGATVYYTTDNSTPSASNGAVYTAPFEITETKTVKAIAVNEAGSSEEVSATYTKIEIPEGQVIDVLNREWTGVSSTSYSNWSSKISNSSAVYAGNSAGDNDAIQLRSTNENSGIVTTTSGGKVKKVIVEWESNTQNGRTLNVYGKNSAYTSPADLYDDYKCGTLLGTIVKGTSTELEVEGNSAYIGLRSNSGAMYLKSITIVWETSTTPVAPTLAADKTFVGSMLVEISCGTDGTTIYYTTDGTEPTSGSKKYSEPFEIEETMTINAVAINEAGPSSVATATYTRVAESPTITFDGDGTFDEDLDVRVGVANGLAYYTLNGEIPTKESTQYVAPLKIKANVTLKVVAYEEGEYVSPVVEQVFKKNKDANTSVGVPTGTATLVKSENDLNVGDQVVIVASGNDVALSTNQKDNNRGQVEITKDGENVILKDDVQRLTLEEGTKAGTYAFYTGTGYLYAASNSSNHLKTQTTNNDNGSWKIDIAANGVATIKAQGTNTRNWLRYNSGNNGQLFSCYGSGQNDVSLYKVKFEVPYDDYVLNVTEAGWATLYLDYAVTIPKGVTCYVVSEVGEESVQLTDVTGVLPAETAVIVKADEGTYNFVASGTEETVNSWMEGTTENKYVKEEAYVLANGDDGVALYKVVMNGGVFLNNANKAYLPASALPQTLNAKALKFNFDTTGVESVKVETEGKKVIYDLSGRRMNEMTQPGVYIVNGKKMMVK